MGFCPTVRKLTEAALKRVKCPQGTIGRIFISKEAVSRLERMVKKKNPTVRLSTIEFRLPKASDAYAMKWARFLLVLYSESLEEDMFNFWLNHGDGISNRHAEFCIRLLDFMDSHCEDSKLNFETSAPGKGDMPVDSSLWFKTSAAEKEVIRSVLAKTIKSENKKILPVSPHDVFLYSTGMMAIGKIAHAMSDVSEGSAAVIFGLVLI